MIFDDLQVKLLNTLVRTRSGTKFTPDSSLATQVETYQKRAFVLGVVALQPADKVGYNAGDREAHPGFIHDPEAAARPRASSLSTQHSVQNLPEKCQYRSVALAPLSTGHNQVIQSRPPERNIIAQVCSLSSLSNGLGANFLQASTHSCKLFRGLHVLYRKF